MADAEVLYRWRVEAEGKPWFGRDQTAWTDHVAWLEARISNPLVRLLIWEADRGPLGMARIDSNGEVAFYAADEDTAVALLGAVQEYAHDYGGRLKISVDQADRTSIEWLERSGFQRFPVKFLAFLE